jgi:hypothetical protein
LCAGGVGGVFDAAHEFPAYAAAAMAWRDFDGLDVGFRLAGFLCPFDDGEAGYAAVFFRDPGRGVGGADKLPHVDAAESMRGLEAEFLDGVEGDEIIESVETIVQK